MVEPHWHALQEALTRPAEKGGVAHIDDVIRRHQEFQDTCAWTCCCHGVVWCGWVCVGVREDVCVFVDSTTIRCSHNDPVLAQ